MKSQGMGKGLWNLTSDYKLLLSATFTGFVQEGKLDLGPLFTCLYLCIILIINLK